MAKQTEVTHVNKSSYQLSGRFPWASRARPTDKHLRRWYYWQHLAIIQSLLTSSHYTCVCLYDDDDGARAMKVTETVMWAAGGLSSLITFGHTGPNICHYICHIYHCSRRLLNSTYLAIIRGGHYFVFASADAGAGQYYYNKQRQQKALTRYRQVREFIFIETTIERPHQKMPLHSHYTRLLVVLSVCKTK